MDEIEVAEPVLKHSQSLSEETLLRVVNHKSQAHMLAVTQRPAVSETCPMPWSSAAMTRWWYRCWPTKRRRSPTSPMTWWPKRAQTSNVLQGPFVRRQGVPIDLLNGLYQKVETELRREIIRKFDAASPADLEKAFERSRTRVTNAYRQMPGDFAKAKARIALLQASGQFAPPVLATLLREGAGARTAFKLAFARLADVEFEVADRAVETFDPRHPGAALPGRAHGPESVRHSGGGPGHLGEGPGQGRGIRQAL